jgi:peptidoglycan/xylan/chitin deacetylase (PgdA/CDA1 family)
MYHAISDDGESVHPYYRTNTSPSVFALQMQQLRELGYSTISLDEAVKTIKADRVSDGRAVVITFDDGYRDFYTYAAPVLTACGFTATMFVPTAHINDVATRFKGRDCLTWSEIQELQSLGMQFGSHTVSHPQLHDLEDSQVEREVAESKDAMEQRLGRGVESFAYPYAFPETDKVFVGKLRRWLIAAGYRNGVCTMIGRADASNNPLFLKRLPVNSCDDHELFAAKLAGAYDWLARPQYVLKRFKAGANRPGTKGFKASISSA